MTENTLSQVAIPSAGLTELKTAFEKALEERKAIDARIEEIRKAIGSRLQEAQSLNDAANNLTEVVIPKKTDKESATFDISLPKVGQFFLKFILPALIMLGVLWFILGSKKPAFTTGSDVMDPTEIQVVRSMESVGG